MTKRTVQLFKDALELPQEERAELASSLLDTLGPAIPVDRSDEEWIAEIERRARAALAGEPGISWEEARAQAKSPARG